MGTLLDRLHNSEHFSDWFGRVLDGEAPHKAALASAERVRDCARKVFADHRPKAERSYIKVVVPPAEVVVPPADEVQRPLGTPFVDQDAALEAHLRQRHGNTWNTFDRPEQIRLMRQARGAMVNRPDLEYTAQFPNIEAFTTLSDDQREALQNLSPLRVQYSHNSPANGVSFFDDQGRLVEVSHGVSPSDYRPSPHMHLLREISDTEDDQVILTTGRPETQEKAIEQAKFLFFRQLARGLQPEKDGIFTLPYVVGSLLPSNRGTQVLSALTPSAWEIESERGFIEQEKHHLNWMRDCTFTFTEGNAKYKVRFKPILLHQQFNTYFNKSLYLPRWATGHERSEEIRREGLEHLRKLAGNHPSLKILSQDYLSPEEMAFHIQLLCQDCNIPLVLHCKSSKDKTGLGMAIALSAYQWRKCGLPQDPQTYALILGKREPTNEREEQLVYLFKTLFHTNLCDLSERMTMYGMGGQGSIAGEAIEELHGLTITECPVAAQFLLHPYVKETSQGARLLYGTWYGACALITCLFGLARFVTGLCLGLLSFALFGAYFWSPKAKGLVDSWVINGVKDMSLLLMGRFVEAIPKYKYSKFAKEQLVFRRKDHPAHLDPILGQLVARLPDNYAALAADPRLLRDFGREVDRLEQALQNHKICKQLPAHLPALIREYRQQPLNLLQQLDHLSGPMYHHLLHCVQSEDLDITRLTPKELALLRTLRQEAPRLLQAGNLTLRQYELVHACAHHISYQLAIMEKQELDQLLQHAGDPACNIHTLSPANRNLLLRIAETLPPDVLSDALQQSHNDIVFRIESLPEEEYQKILWSQQTNNVDALTPQDFEWIATIRAASYQIEIPDGAILTRAQTLIPLVNTYSGGSIACNGITATSEQSYAALLAYIQDPQAKPDTLSPFQRALLVLIANSMEQLAGDDKPPRVQALVQACTASDLPIFRLPQRFTLAQIQAFDQQFEEESLSTATHRYLHSQASKMEEHGPFYVAHQLTADYFRGESEVIKMSFGELDDNGIFQPVEIIEPQKTRTPEARQNYLQKIISGVRCLEPLEDVEQIPLTLQHALSQTARSQKALLAGLSQFMLRRIGGEDGLFQLNLDPDAYDIRLYAVDGQIYVEYNVKNTIRKLREEIGEVNIGYRYILTQDPATKLWNSQLEYTADPSFQFYTTLYGVTHNSTWQSPADVETLIGFFLKADKRKTVEHYSNHRIDPDKRPFYRQMRNQHLQTDASAIEGLPYYRLLENIDNLTEAEVQEIEEILGNIGQMPANKYRRLFVEIGNALDVLDAEDPAFLDQVLNDRHRRVFQACRASNLPMFKLHREVSGFKANLPPQLQHQPGILKAEIEAERYPLENIGNEDDPFWVYTELRTDCRRPYPTIEAIDGEVIRPVMAEAIDAQAIQGAAEPDKPKRRIRALHDKLRCVSSLRNEATFPPMIQYAFRQGVYGIAGTLRCTQAALFSQGKLRLTAPTIARIEFHDLGPNDIRVRYFEKYDVETLDHKNLGKLETSFSLYLHKDENGEWTDTEFALDEWQQFRFENRDENFVLPN